MTPISAPLRSPSRTALSGLAVLVLLTAVGAANAAVGVSGKPKVSFFAEGSPGALDIEGVTNTLTVVDNGTTLVFTVPMSTVQTGIDLRDDHMNNEFVQIAQFPNATLTLNRADIKFPSATLGEQSNGTVKGVFNVHGTDVTIDVTYNLMRSKTGYRAKASFNFDASAHGISVPSYLGVTVDPKMRAEVNVDLVDA